MITTGRDGVKLKKFHNHERQTTNNRIEHRGISHVCSVHYYDIITAMNEIKFEVGKRYRHPNGSVAKCVSTYGNCGWLVHFSDPLPVTATPIDCWREIPDIDLDMFPAKAAWAWNDAAKTSGSVFSVSKPDPVCDNLRLWGVMHWYKIPPQYTIDNPLDLDQLRKDPA